MATGALYQRHRRRGLSDNIDCHTILYVKLAPCIWLVTFGAYLPASSLAALAALSGPGSAALDPALMTVPFCAGFGIGFLPWGALADRFDRWSVISVAAALMTAAGLLVALAPSTEVAVAGRVLAGLAAAGVPPAAQALLAARGGAGTGGRLAGMMVAVGFATLGGPLAAQGLAGMGWTAAAAILGCAGPLLAAAVAVTSARGRSRAVAVAAERQRFSPSRGVLAGWLVAALVLGGYWTVLTRLGLALAEQEAHGLLGALSLLAALGIPLAVVAGRVSDRLGPRAPMVAATAVGAGGYAAAAAAPTAGAFVVAAALAMALYWAYLPVVAVQVVRSCAEATRGRAVGGMYASMWLGAAVAGAAATTAPSWRHVLAGAAVAWALAAIVAARSFHRRASAGWGPSRPPLATAQPSRA